MTTQTPAASTVVNKVATINNIDIKAPLNNEGNVVDLMKLYKTAFERVAPKHLDLNRMMRVALMTVSRSKTLLECTGSSLLGAFMLSAQMGLDIAAREAHLVPFRNKHTKQREIVLVPDYRGIIKLIRNSGEIANLRARLVYKGDTFTHEEGMVPKLIHIPNYEGRRSDEDILGAYSCADFCDRDRQPTGYVDAHFLTIGHLRKIKAGSPSGNDGPWVTHFGEMCLKTVIKHHAKTLPYSVELNIAVTLDNQVEMGKPQQIALLGSGPDDVHVEMIPEDDGDDTPGDKNNVTPKTDDAGKSALDRVVDANKKPDAPTSQETKQEPIKTLEQQRKETAAAGAGKKSDKPRNEPPPEDDGIDPETPMSVQEFNILEGERLEHNVEIGVWYAWAKKKFDVKMIGQLRHKHFKTALAWTVAGGTEAS